MSKNLFAFVTFGGLSFTELAVRSIRETVKNPFDLFAVIGKPGDIDTKVWLESENIPYIYHTENMGFPCSVNDIYDYAWKQNDYDNLILLGNDVVLYPYAGDSLINLANTSDYEVISALQYDVKDLIREHPEQRDYFRGEDCIFFDFGSRPWDAFSNYSDEYQIADMQLYDIQNLCLYKKSIFKTIGYTDVNFYPAYYIDNDYARRIVNAGIRCCSLVNARFFHFWSRTMKQGTGGSTNHFFENNRRYYIAKWGGDFAKETKQAPIGIFTREGEKQIIDYWKGI